MSQQVAWWCNQIGIAVEILGAGYLVFCAWKSKRVVAGMKTDADSIDHSVDALLGEVRDNFNSQRRGFVFFVLGLSMQLASNCFLP